VAAYDAEHWHELFVMMGGAAAALAGLIFVAVSLNHEQILSLPKLPSLAGRTLSLLIGLVVLCALGLAPQPALAFGIELTVVGVVLAAIVVGTTLHTFEKGEPARWRASNLGTALAASVPAVVAGVTLIAGAGGGLFWLLAEFAIAIVVSAYYAWVLLIEIRR
jgi:hypothetical protein